MKKLIPLFILSACSLGGRMVTMEEFSEIDISTTSEQVVSSLGEPYAVHKKADGTVEYEYIERITIGSRYAEERHYFIVMKEGKVVSKRVNQSSPLPYGFDSYDMQTTQQSQTN
ncbi:MAG: hypothetical protein COT85_06480 [Chlamydiae bacterium CG10_big_fil_rev_8_21_14_0_10_42_34]|nr:MAG: hypothetical protein COT85_06480 [Chlamydiae bacterium CG10_big_fil_rev_8_21_14_0_10_42_34]